MEEKTEQSAASQLSLFHRLVLKLPCPNLGFLPRVSQGIFWALVVPIFLVFEFFLTLYLLVGFSFPLNLLLAGVVPFVVFMMFPRISLERLVTFLNTAVAESRFEWDMNKSTDEYIRIIEKTKSKKKQ